MRKSVIGAAIPLVASLALASSTLAASAFTNGSFEDGWAYGGDGYHTLAAGTADATAMDGWTVTAGNVDWVSNNYSTWMSDDGTYSVDMNGTGDAGGSAAGTISQEFETVANDTYTVQFWVSNNTSCGPSTKSMTYSVDGSSGSVDVPDSSSVYSGDWFAAPPVSFMATSASATITLEADASNTSNCGVVVDNVTVTQTAATGAQCKQGGWQEMVDSVFFAPFTNQGRCVSSYAKAGAVPIGSGKTDTSNATDNTNSTGAQCKHGGWQSVVDSNGASFKNQGACVSYVAKGGVVMSGS